MVMKTQVGAGETAAECGSPRQTGASVLKTWLVGGDKTDFDLFSENVWRVFYCICRRLGLKHPDAQDVLQDALMKIYTKRTQIRPDETAYACVHRIALNTAKDWIRKTNTLGRDERMTDSLDDPDRPIQVLSDVNPEREYERYDERQRINKALGLLSETDRKLLVMLFISELEPQEVASIL